MMLKRNILFALFALCFSSAGLDLLSSTPMISTLSPISEDCDLIYPYDKEKIRCLVQEVTPEHVKYVLCEDTKGEVLTLPAGEVRLITYSDGRNRVVNRVIPDDKGSTTYYEDYGRSGKKIKQGKTKTVGIVFASLIALYYIVAIINR